MVLSLSKDFYMCLGSKSEINDYMPEERTMIPVTLEHAILGIMIDNNLIYSHLKQLYKKVANKLNALTRIILYLDEKHINLLCNSFFKGQLSYYPLMWTFSFRRSNNLTNKLQERALRVVYIGYNFNFNKLLKMVDENTIRIKNILILCI